MKEQQKPVTKKTYLAHNAPPKLQAKSVLVWVCCLVAWMLIIVSIMIPLMMPYQKIPMISAYLAVTEGNPDAQLIRQEMIFQALEEGTQIVQYLPQNEAPEVIRRVTQLSDAIKTKPSLVNLSKLFQELEKKGEAYPNEEIADCILTGEYQGRIFYTTATILFLLPGILYLLAGIFKSTVMSILAAVTAVLIQWMYCGALLPLLTVIVCIFQCILCTRINRSYKAWKAQQQ